MKYRVKGKWTEKKEGRKTASLTSRQKTWALELIERRETLIDSVHVATDSHRIE